MAATAYIVAASPSSPEPKRITNLKSAKREADARAKLDRVDVAVTTEATGKVSYTAQGAPVTAVDVPALADPVADEAPGSVDMSGFEAALAEVVGDDAPADDEDGSQGDEGDAPAPAADDTPAAPADDAHRGQAACGCSVEKIIEKGEHGKGCADAPKAAEAARSVERDKPARPARTGGGTRRESQGEAAADGWELLYDKPKQKAQVGRKDGRYALICTVHKHAHPLTRLVSERGLRQGKRSAWCPECTD